MKKSLSWPLLTLLLAVSLPIIVGGVEFGSHHAEIEKLIQTSDPLERNLPAPLRKALLFSLDDRTTPFATRLLIRNFYSDIDSESWKVTYALWVPFVAACFSEDDRLAIIARLSSTGGGRFGLSETALAMFGHSLSDLSYPDLATLVVLTKQPSLYNQPEKLSIARDQFITRFEHIKG